LAEAEKQVVWLIQEESTEVVEGVVMMVLVDRGGEAAGVVDTRVYRGGG
jgi:hypothetical protein